MNAFIEELLLERGVERTPNAERVVENPETHQLRAEPLSELPSDHLSDAVDKLTEANAIFGDGSEGNDPYGALTDERRMIGDAVEKYAGRPRRLYDTCRRVSRRIRGKAARGDCPELEKDALIQDYLHEIEETAEDLRNFDPKVAEVVAARVQSGIAAAGESAQGILEAAAEEIAPALEGELAEDVPTDVAVATDANEPEESRREATYRLTSRLTRIYKIARSGLAEATAVSKELAIVLATAGTVGGALYAAVQFLLALL